VPSGRSELFRAAASYKMKVGLGSGMYINTAIVAMTRTVRLAVLIGMVVLASRVPAQSFSEEDEYLCAESLMVMPPVLAPLVREVSKTAQDTSTVIKAVVKRTFELAQEGDSDAQAFAGYLLATGYCLPRDMPHAIEWFTRAAENGNAKAQHRLGIAYLTGTDGMFLSLPKDPPKGLRWLNSAAEQGNRDSQWALAQAFGTGHHQDDGIPQDLVRAYMWYTILGIDRETEKLAQNMTALQVADARRLADDWTQKRPQRTR